MSSKMPKPKRTPGPLAERAIMLDLSDELAEYLTTVSRKLAPVLGGKDADYEGFCFIARDRKTQKIRAHVSMHVPNDRVATTYNGSDVEDLQLFVYAWANHTFINKMVRAK
jgi:hypothetical protein